MLRSARVGSPVPAILGMLKSGMTPVPGGCLQSARWANRRSWTENTSWARGEKAADLPKAAPCPLGSLRASPSPRERAPGTENCSLGASSLAELQAEKPEVW